jgi:hypothetical protein
MLDWGARLEDLDHFLAIQCRVEDRKAVEILLSGFDALPAHPVRTCADGPRLNEAPSRVLAPYRPTQDHDSMTSTTLYLPQGAVLTDQRLLHGC